MTTRELRVTVRRRDGPAVIDLVGDVDASAEQALEDGYAQATATGASRVVLNFEGTQYINSTGIALIVGLLGQARKQRVELAAFGLSDHYREIFEITRLADFMTIADGEAAPSAAPEESGMPDPATTFGVRVISERARVIDITGDVTAQSEDVLMDAYGRASAPGVTAIVLSFDGLDYMNSGGIGLLVMLLVRAQRKGQQVLAYGLSEHYREIFELTRLDEAVGIHATQDAALAAAG